ncbi:MAG TPA: hypothetical protein VKE72_05760 [Methylocella sp.]|nr:hypothetical protein [Methylocella sp.]
MKRLPAAKEVGDWSKATAGLLPDFHGAIKAGQGSWCPLPAGAGTTLA